MVSDSRPSSVLPRAQDDLLLSLSRPSFHRKAKRGLDVCLATLGMIMLFPLMLLICALIWLGSGGPVLYKQQRIGMAGRRFQCLKFRTMVPNADKVLQELLETSADARDEWEQSFKLKKDPRITPFGKFLRQTSLDELPQLFNVLVGDMSLVGPRPIVANEMARYGDVLPLYFSIRPGLTGIWQISGRSDCSYQERVAYDEQYVRNLSLKNDILIILRTFEAVFSRRGSF
ncbi:sugar transferase [Microvirga aerilata]|uniref:Sugar transferase n=1 Tax=Microvirga aerilata TaxID=670292 RepID=A0A936ZKF5_9HYPH|nr:sugar transferase [Microvirga aerilata]MBL0407660.1 sugar transferase [Microvirga aerilata]